MIVEIQTAGISGFGFFVGYEYYDIRFRAEHLLCPLSTLWTLKVDVSLVFYCWLSPFLHPDSFLLSSLVDFVALLLYPFTLFHWPSLACLHTTQILRLKPHLTCASNPPVEEC